MNTSIKHSKKPDWLREIRFEEFDIIAGAAREFGAEPAIVYVAEGRLLACAVDDSGKHLSAHVCGPGALIGLERLDAARLHDKVFYQLWAITDARIEKLSLSDVLDFVDRLPTPTQSLMGSLLSALDRRTGSRDLARERVLARLAMFLLDATTDSAPLRLPRYAMAHALSMRPETVSRTLKELERRGAISLHARRKRDGLVAGDVRVTSRSELEKIVLLGL